MATFALTTSPTPFAFFDSDTDFSSEADKLVTYVKRSLGDDVLSVELTKKQIWASFEFAVLDFGAIINEFSAKSQIQDLLGLPTGSLSGSETKYVRENLEFLSRQAEAYSSEMGLGGSYNTLSGSIALETGRQDYNIYTELKNGNGTVVTQTIPSGSRGKLKVFEVFHFKPDVSFLAQASSTATNYLSAEFSFESYTRGTQFYVLPVYEDVLRMNAYDTAFRVRRSHYSYQIVGANIRIYPVPTSADPRKLFLRVGTPVDPLNPSYQDDTVYGASGIQNLPFGNLTYANINSWGKQWIRKYAVALCKEILGQVRSKFNKVPIPGDELILNGERMLTDAREDKAKLIEELRETLESFTYLEIARRESEKAELLNKQLQYIPIIKPIILG